MNGEPQTTHRFVSHALYSTRSNKIFLVLTVNKHAGIMAWHGMSAYCTQYWTSNQYIYARSSHVCLHGVHSHTAPPSSLSSFDSGRIDRWNSTSKASGPRWSGCHKIGPNTAALAPPDTSNEEPIIVCCCTCGSEPRGYICYNHSSIHSDAAPPRQCSRISYATLTTVSSNTS